MAQREKRSISLPPGLAREIAQAAARNDTSFSGWLAETATRRLKLEAGRRALAEWEREHGALTAEELAEAEVIVRASLGRGRVRRPRRSA
jgi:hypothetical protein